MTTVHDAIGTPLSHADLPYHMGTLRYTWTCSNLFTRYPSLKHTSIDKRVVSLQMKSFLVNGIF